MPTLKDTFKLGNITPRNRLVMPPLTINQGSPEGRVTPDVIRFYKARSRAVGMVIVDAMITGRRVAEAGADMLDLSLAIQGTWKDDGGRRVLTTTSAQGRDETPGEVVDAAAGFRRECGLPVIAVGRLGSEAAAMHALNAGADLVAMGRQMICDPGGAAKILLDNPDPVVECDVCQTCFASLGKGSPVLCRQNRNLPE